MVVPSLVSSFISGIQYVYINHLTFVGPVGHNSLHILLELRATVVGCPGQEARPPPSVSGISGLPIPFSVPCIRVALADGVSLSTGVALNFENKQAKNKYN